MSATAADLSPDAIAAIDTGQQLRDILGLPDQLRDALWRVESAQLEPHDATGGLVIAGMGGSGIGGPPAGPVRPGPAAVAPLAGRGPGGWRNRGRVAAGARGAR